LLLKDNFALLLLNAPLSFRLVKIVKGYVFVINVKVEYSCVFEKRQGMLLRLTQKKILRPENKAKNEKEKIIFKYGKKSRKMIIIGYTH